MENSLIAVLIGAVIILNVVIGRHAEAKGRKAARDDYQALIDYWKAESLRGSDREAACLEQVELLHAFCNKTKLLKSPFVDIRTTASLLRLSVLPNLLSQEGK